MSAVCNRVLNLSKNEDKKRWSCGRGGTRAEGPRDLRQQKPQWRKWSKYAERRKEKSDGIWFIGKSRAVFLSPSLPIRPLLSVEIVVIDHSTHTVHRYYYIVVHYMYSIIHSSAAEECKCDAIAPELLLLHPLWGSAAFSSNCKYLTDKMLFFW